MSTKFETVKSAGPGLETILTLPASGVGLTHTLLGVHILQFKYAFGVPAAPIVGIDFTWTNLSGACRISFPQEAFPPGGISDHVFRPSPSLQSVASNIETKIIAPATSGVVWRISAWYEDIIV